MICPECESEAISKIEGSSIIIECSECGWSVATSYVDPMFEDETVYSITVGCGNASSKEALGAVSRVTGKNYIAAKAILESPGDVLFQGKAPEVVKWSKELSSSGVVFKVSPRFPY